MQCRTCGSESSHLSGEGLKIEIPPFAPWLRVELQGHQVRGVSSLQKWWITQLQKPNKYEYWQLDVCPACTEEVKGSWVRYLQFLIRSHNLIISLVDKTAGSNNKN